MPRVRGLHGPRLDNAVERVEGAVARVLRSIARTIAALVGASPSTAALSDDDLQPIRREWEQAVAVEIVPAVMDAYAESAQTLVSEFADAGRDVPALSLDAPETADFLDAATNRLVGVSDTLWEIARKELADGIRAGEGVEELAARLQEAGGFGTARARMIARTEVVAASNAASLAQALRLGDPSMSKVWLDSDDDRVRPAHEAVDGQSVPLGEPFEVGGEFLMYPGQPIGSASNVINERCGLGYSWDEPLTAAGPDEFHLPGKHDQSEHGKDGPNAPDITGGRTAAGNTNAGGRAGRDPTSVGETVKRYGPKSLTLAAHDDGQLSLTDDNGNTVRLTAADVDSLRASALDSYDMQVGDEFAVRHTEDRGGTPYTTLRMLVQKTAAIPDEEAEEGEESYLRDTLAVHLAPNDDPDFDELRAAPPVEMTARELADLATALTDLETAGRVDTGHGQVDMFTDGRSWVLRPVDGPELRLNRRGFRTLDRALDAVVDDFDGENGPGPGGLPGEADTAERTVDTNIGTVTVSLKGGLGVGDLTIRVHDPDMEIVVAPAQQSAFLRQFGSLSEVLTASAVRRRGVAMPAVVPIEAVVTAAAEVHTGAMIALRPSAADAERLAVDGGEPADQLHCTMAYLGEAADIPPELRQGIIDRIRALVEDAIRPDYDLPLVVDGFAVSMFNPPGVEHPDGRDRSSCVVLGLSGDDLDAVHKLIQSTLEEVFAEHGLVMPAQHAPFNAHLTLEYTDDATRVEQLLDRAGPVTFDAIWVAFGGENTDIPLAPAGGSEDAATAGSSDLEDASPEGWSEFFAARIAEFVASDQDLREYWVHGEGATRIRWGTDGDFTRCVRLLGRHVRDPEGLCAEYHKESVGTWPGEKKDHAAEASHADAAPVVIFDAEPGTFASELDAQPGEHFHTWVMEGVSTGLRQFAPGAITWREPPFAYHWQWKSSAHNGLPETVQTGLVTRVVRDGNVVHFFGKLDLKSPEGLDYARRVAEGWARWSSVGVDESVKNANIDVEYVLADSESSLDEEPEVDLMTFRDYRVAEVTGVSVPALADALVEPTPELIATLTDMGVIDPTPQAGTEPPEETPEDTMGDTPAVHDAPAVVVAAGHTITLPEAPPAAWFDEPADDELPPYGSVRVDANGRLIGLLAPAEVNHRSFPGKRVKVPMGNVDYSGWQNKPHHVAEGHSINVGVITMNCGHASTSPGDWSYTNRREHYDNTCSIAAHARAYEKPGIGVALAGAIAPWLDAEGFGKLLSSDLSGDWPPHPDKPGWRDFIAALAVPVGGFANRARLRVAEGALVAAAVPVQFDDMEIPMEMAEEAPLLVEGTRVRVLDPRDPEVTEGEIAVVHTGPAYALLAPGRDEPVRWYVAEELELTEAVDEELPVEAVDVEEMVAAAGPDMGPAMEVIARRAGRDPASRMAALRNRVHRTD